MEDFIKRLPKCELHMHLFGNLEPSIVFKLAKRNNVSLPYETPEELQAAYNFKNLEEFLDLFGVCLKVIQTPQDIYDVLIDYYVHCKEDNVRYAEIYFGTRLFNTVDISPKDSLDTITKAVKDGFEQYGVKSKIILGLNRTCGEKVAYEHLDLCKDYLDINQTTIKNFSVNNKPIVAVGLACSERDYPPSMYQNFFKHVKEIGLKSTIHAGEEGPSEYIAQAIDLAGADRIDHGTTADDEMIERLAREKIPVTACPISNLRLKVIKSLSEHPLKRQLDAGVIISINSDDPSYFGGYINENFIETQKALNLTREEIIQIAKNSYLSAFISEEEKHAGIQEIDQYVRDFDHEHE